MADRFKQDVGLEEYKQALSVTKEDFRRALGESMTNSTVSLFLEYGKWRALVKAEEMHLGRMLAEETLKGYISTTRAVTTAKFFGSGYRQKPGWVYCVLVRGGYVVPPKGKTAWTQFFGEQEIAYPGPILWNDVVGFRKVKQDGFFEGPLYLRSNLYKDNGEAAKQISLLLSGRKQIKY
jgi:hypothetical protein